MNLFRVTHRAVVRERKSNVRLNLIYVSCRSWNSNVRFNLMLVAEVGNQVFVSIVVSAEVRSNDVDIKYVGVKLYAS